MPHIAYPPSRPLSVGEVLDLAFRIYHATVVRCLLLSSLGVLAGEVWRIYSLARAARPPGLQSLTAQLREPPVLALYIAGLLAQMVLLSAVVLRQYRLVTGPQIGGELAGAARRLPALIGLTLLLGITASACFVPVLVGGALRPLFQVLGLLALIGISLRLLSSSAILLTEHTGALASYRRSWRLTEGSFWRLALIYAIAMAIFLAIYVVLGIVIGSLGLILGQGDVAVATAAGAVLAIAVGALVVPLYTALSLAILADLKTRREGTDLERRIAAAA
jgi:hypothetical protein